MRESLLRGFDDIYLLDLHGNTKKKETTPEGGKDENVFDIQQGVAIGIFVRRENQERKEDHRARVFHGDLFGLREEKYAVLDRTDVGATEWAELTPASPDYYFVPQVTDVAEEYKTDWIITEVMPTNVLGFQTHRDHFALDIERDKLQARIRKMRMNELSDSEFLEKYSLKNSGGWDLSKARSALRVDDEW